MKFSDIFKAVFIIFAFFLTYLISLVMTNLNNVKKIGDCINAIQ